MTPKTSVTAALLNVLPIHDARLVSLEVVPVINGDLRLRVLFQLHPDESLDEITKLGVGTRLLRATFERCWQITSNLLGTGSTRETIAGWSIIEPSELVHRLQSHGFASGVELQHHRFELSGGSSVDVLADEAIFLQASAAAITG